MDQWDTSKVFPFTGILAYDTYRHIYTSFLPHQISRHEPMVQLIPIYLGRFRNTDREGMLSRPDIRQENLFRHHIGTRTTVGT